MIRINSVTDRSNLPLIRFLIPLVKRAGLKYRVQNFRENGETFANLLVFRRSLPSRPRLIFNTHLDTVTPGVRSNWTKTQGNPFKVTRRGDAIFGLGVADVKIDFLCKLWALSQAGEAADGVVLVGTYGEERGLVGARKLLESKLIRPKYALVGEPSELELVYAHKGHLIGEFRVLAPRKPSQTKTKTWKGTAAHSSTPHLGKNAFSLALREVRKKKLGIVELSAGTDMNKIPERCEIRFADETNVETQRLLAIIGRLESIGLKTGRITDKRFKPSKSTLSFNKACTRSGYWEVIFDIRTVPGVDVAKLEKEVRRALGKDGKWISLTADAPLRGKDNSRLMRTAATALRRTGLKPRAITKSSSTEAAVYNQHGAQAVIFGPGVSIGNVHKPNERNSLRQIDSATQFYLEFLKFSQEEL